ncbi:MAG: hypothetical protein CMP23_13835 [Rickettsiales bacterium]|nr:hypothetical protein [Rickettsiales bacterium]
MDRRNFLKLCSASLLSGSAWSCQEPVATGGSGPVRDSVGPGPALPGPLPVSNEPWGVPPKGSEHTLLPSEARPEAMLEVFLLGGMSPWETFYTVPEFCDPSIGGDYSGQQWWMFQDGGRSVESWFGQCDGGSRALYEPFAADSAGVTVNLGPFIYPLRDRPDILSRLRVWVLRHNVEPHAVAIPFAVAGQGVSNPRMAGLGTHLQRFFGEQDSERSAPSAYTIYMSSFDRSNNGAAASALGLHPAAAQPIALQLGPNPRLPARLPRPGVADYKSELDALVDHYTRQLRARLDHAIAGGLRSPAYNDFEAIRRAMGSHQVLADLLPSSLFDLPDVTLCSSHPGYPQSAEIFTVTDETTAALEMARHLITAGSAAPRYVQVMEGGVFTDPTGQGYDTHAEHVYGQGPNLMHMCRSLAAIINEPGEDDPNKLDLDRHFVLLNTEFGRAPIPEVTPANPGGRGTNHWPWGYVVVGFGGFADEERSGVVGSIGEDALANLSFTPTEHRAAMLLAMGVWPFSQESFAVGDVTDVGSELDAAIKLREQLLGYPL